LLEPSTTTRHIQLKIGSLFARHGGMNQWQGTVFVSDTKKRFEN